MVSPLGVVDTCRWTTTVAVPSIDELVPVTLTLRPRAAVRLPSSRMPLVVIVMLPPGAVLEVTVVHTRSDTAGLAQSTPTLVRYAPTSQATTAGPPASDPAGRSIVCAYCSVFTAPVAAGGTGFAACAAGAERLSPATAAHAVAARIVVRMGFLMGVCLGSVGGWSPCVTHHPTPALLRGGFTDSRPYCVYKTARAGRSGARWRRHSWPRAAAA